MDTCGQVTPGTGSGDGVTFESVHAWPQVQGLGVVRVSPLSTIQDCVYPETASLPFSCSVSCSPEISNIWAEGVALIYLWSFVSSYCIHMRSGTLGQLCSVFYWATDNPWCTVSEPRLRLWPRHSEACPLTPLCGEGKEVCVAGAEQGGQGRPCLKGSRSVKAGVMEWVVCSGTVSWLAGGEVIGSEHHHLLILTGLASACLWAARSQFLHLMGVSACIRQLTGYGSEHFLQPLRRNTDPWLCLMAKLLFSLLWQFSFLSAYSHFSG